MLLRRDWRSLENRVLQRQFRLRCRERATHRREVPVWNRLTAVLLLVASAAAAANRVQLSAGQAPREFEVASVKPNLLDDRIVQVRVGPGPTFMARGYTLVLLMQRAYGVMDWNVSSGPDWIRSDRWDVQARADIAGDLKEEILQPMLANLLAKRFKLRVHETSEERSAYALEIARGGLKVRQSTSSENGRDSGRFTDTGLEFTALSMTDFARFVSGKLGLVGVDQTGLPGLYDFKADWRVTPGQTDLAGGDPREPLRAAVFSALETQLGLKLTPKKVPVRMIVIDSVEKASALDN
jgi:uncharacterized protein (TIGR03435 family)